MYYPQTFQQTFPQYPQNTPQYAFAQRHEIIKVNGKNGAEAFQMAPNSQVLLLDETAPIVWLKTTDGAGYPTVMAYNIAPVQERKEADRFDEIEKRIAKLEGLINDKPDYRSNEPKQAYVANGAD